MCVGVCRQAFIWKKQNSFCINFPILTAHELATNLQENSHANSQVVWKGPLVAKTPLSVPVTEVSSSPMLFSAIRSSYLEAKVVPNVIRLLFVVVNNNVGSRMAASYEVCSWQQCQQGLGILDQFFLPTPDICMRWRKKTMGQSGGGECSF